MIYKEAFLLWQKNVTDIQLKNQLNTMTDADLEDSFYKELEFGTGGLRGKIGAGTNRMNIYTVKKATQGIADYLIKVGGKKVAISFDSRHKSHEFAKLVASVFSQNNIKAVITLELMPTPFLSYLTRSANCDAGVMITASHNPSVFNGYKVYGKDGCQITSKVAEDISNCICKIDPFKVNTMEFDLGLEKGLIEYASENIEKEYFKDIFKLSFNKCEKIKVVYTPLNGAGYRLVPLALKGVGVQNITYVTEQNYPSGDFATCPYPNPEFFEAIKLGLDCLKKTQADILLATDPDCDRLGVSINKNGEVTSFTGNELGILLLDYIIKMKLKNHTMPQNGVIIKTIVTTNLASLIAKKHNIKVINVLTGFKYIGEQINELDKQFRQNDFIFGFEESCGYLASTFVRDKDAVSTSMLVAEMTEYYLSHGKTLKDILQQVYLEFGEFKHKLLNFSFEGVAGAKKIIDIMTSFRDKKPLDIAQIKVEKIIDYLYQTELNLPKENMLQFDLENDCQVIIRPSGTEAKIKIYLTVCCKGECDIKKLQDLESYFTKILS